MDYAIDYRRVKENWESRGYTSSSFPSLLISFCFSHKAVLADIKSGVITPENEDSIIRYADFTPFGQLTFVTACCFSAPVHSELFKNASEHLMDFLKEAAADNLYQWDYWTRIFSTFYNSDPVYINYMHLEDMTDVLKSELRISEYPNANPIEITAYEF